MRIDLQKRSARWYERLTLVHAIWTIIGLALLIVLVSGAVIRLVEPETFTSLGLAYWYAITTVTTVGYGDVVPHTAPGRIVGAMIMLTGLSLFPTLTSVIVSILITKRSRAQQEELSHQSDEFMAAVARMEERLARIDERGRPTAG